MLLPRIVAGLLLLAGLVPQVGAQTCLQNLVPNGGFEDVATDPWTVSPPGAAVVYYGIVETDGLRRSRAVELRLDVLSCVLEQPTPFRLDAGTAYEFSVQLEGGPGTTDVELAVRAGSTRTILASTRLQPERQLLTGRFVAPSTGDYTIDVGLLPVTRGAVRVDEVVVRPVPVQFAFVGGRRAGFPNLCTVEGPPLETFVVLLGVDGTLETPFPIPLCTGGLWLRPPVFSAIPGQIGPDGRWIGFLSVPIGARAVPTYWQPLLLAQPCETGCPRLFGFF
ncbi:MAG: hypothetical protein ACO4CT_16355 [Planctomycetota bacterium]|jgi:hypothetical protein